MDECGDISNSNSSGICLRSIAEWRREEEFNLLEQKLYYARTSLGPRKGRGTPHSSFVDVDDEPPLHVLIAASPMMGTRVPQMHIAFNYSVTTLLARFSTGRASLLRFFLLLRYVVASSFDLFTHHEQHLPPLRSPLLIHPCTLYYIELMMSPLNDWPISTQFTHPPWSMVSCSALLYTIN